jgi:hypothetical protein
MSFDDLLEGWMSERRDVTFPVHPDDAPSSFRHFGFTDTGGDFSPSWTIRFAADARLQAAFTGVVFAHRDEDEYFLDLAISAASPIRPLAWFPRWYPMPDYARYGPFTEPEVRSAASGLLVEDEPAITALLGPAGSTDVATRLEANRRRFPVVRNAVEAPIGDVAPDTIEELVELFVTEQLPSGIPVAAGEVLVRRSAGEDFDFTLHPSIAEGLPGAGDLDPQLFMDPAFYFGCYGSRIIEEYDRYPAQYKERSIAPPLTSARAHFVRETPDPAITATQHATINDALRAAHEHDVILILDKASYVARGVRVTKYVSILGLVSRDDDPRTLKSDPEATLRGSLSRRYPTIRSNDGFRGLRIRYENGQLRRTRRGASSGMIYIAGVSISGSVLDVDAGHHHNLGGAGVLIQGNHHDPPVGDADPVQLGTGFSAVHLHRCAIASNHIVSSRNRDLPLQGGGVMCVHSSPVIADCLIRFNRSVFQGGGIGIYRYSFPRILDNVISNNTAAGWSEAFHGGDGGGIGIFQAPPVDERARALEDRIAAMDEFERATHIREIDDWVRATWDTPDLEDARRYRVAIVRNEIRNNRAGLSGGGVYATVSAYVRLHDNQITENTAVLERGGGLGVTYGSDVIVHGGTIHRNESRALGGGIYMRSSRLELESCDVTENTCLLNGGGIGVEARPEILLHGNPVYDIVLQNVFTHIARVELVLRGVDVARNVGVPIPSLYAFRNDDEYDRGGRGQYVTVGLFAPLQIRIDVDGASTIFPAGSAEHLDGSLVTRAIVPGTPLEL